MHELKVTPPKSTLVPSATSSPTTVGRIDCLTGLRFVAALLVFIHHLGDRFGFAGTGLPLANNAVSFFFVLFWPENFPSLLFYFIHIVGLTYTEEEYQSILQEVSSPIGPFLNKERGKQLQCMVETSWLY